MCGQEKMKYSEGQRSPFFRFSWATVKKVVSQVVTWPAASGVFFAAKKGRQWKKSLATKRTRQSNLSYSHSQFPHSTLGTPITSKPIFLATNIKRLAFYDWGFPTEVRVISSRDSCSQNNAELFCKGGLKNVQTFARGNCFARWSIFWWLSRWHCRRGSLRLPKLLPCKVIKVSPVFFPLLYIYMNT